LAPLWRSPRFIADAAQSLFDGDGRLSPCPDGLFKRLNGLTQPLALLACPGPGITWTRIPGYLGVQMKRGSLESFNMP
jgi:hypothetical protein